MKKNFLFIIVLLIAQNIFSQTGGRRFFTKSFYVNNVTLLELTDDLGQSLNVNNIYKVQLVTTGTGTKTGTEYLVWNSVTTALWQIRAVNLSGNSSNHPLLIVDNNKVKVYTKHTDKYTVLAFVEEIISNENDVQPSIFGSSFQWQRDGLSLFYEGNVGIGVETPFTKLSVAGSLTINSGLNNTFSRPAVSVGTLVNGEVRGYSTAGNTFDDGFLRLSAGGGTTVGVKSYIDLSGYSTVPDMNRNIVFGTSGVECMRIDQNGNIGIGTNAPDAKLAVNGNIHSREVKVDVNFPAPDYVFANDYKLRSLQEVENFVNQNSHLPEIPSAKEFEKNGIQLAEMNMALLKKIEELTLYAIEQQKNMEKLNKIVEEQNKRLQILEKK